LKVAIPVHESTGAESAHQFENTARSKLRRWASELRALLLFRWIAGTTSSPLPAPVRLPCATKPEQADHAPAAPCPGHARDVRGCLRLLFGRITGSLSAPVRLRGSPASDFCSEDRSRLVQRQKGLMVRLRAAGANRRASATSEDHVRRSKLWAPTIIPGRGFFLWS
jgi:hypothetical protein